MAGDRIQVTTSECSSRRMENAPTASGEGNEPDTAYHNGDSHVEEAPDLLASEPDRTSWKKLNEQFEGNVYCGEVLMNEVPKELHDSPECLDARQNELR